MFSADICDSDACDALFSNVSCCLSPVQSKICEGLLTSEECLSALLGMARWKAPGNDGFPMEFYLKFWHILGSDLIDVLNACFAKGTLVKSQRSGVISLSFKKGDRLDPRNWRPTFLLNVDYKIASKAIAGRLFKVIDIVVNSDQTCGVPGRFIGDNVSFLRDIVHHATSSNIPVAILSLDQEKAFHRVSWSFL